MPNRSGLLIYPAYWQEQKNIGVCAYLEDYAYESDHIMFMKCIGMIGLGIKTGM